MITLNSEDKDILREMNEGFDKALYWLVKSVGSKRAEAEYFHDVYDRVKKSGNNEAGDVVEYIDKNGNRWRSCFVLIPREDNVINVSQSFVYYETLGSCGAFVPYIVSDTIKNHGVMIFTPHFFQRMCERLDIPYRSSAMIQKFLAMMTHFTLQINEDNVIVNLPGSQGRGIFRYMEDDGHVLEIRTFLTNQQLNKKQKHETEKLRRLGEIKPMFDFEIKKLSERLHGCQEDQEAVINDILDQCEVRGMDRDVVKSSHHDLSFIVDRFMDLGYTYDENDTIDKVFEFAFLFMYDAIEKCKMNGKNKKPFPKSLDRNFEVIRIARYTAEKMGISQFNLKDFMSFDCKMNDEQAEMLGVMLKEYEEVHKDEHKAFGEKYGVSMYD